MLSPTTLSFSVLALVLGDRPLRTGFWFYLGALSATLVIGVVAAFVLGDAAASKGPPSPKPWGAIVDLVAAGAILGWVAVIARRPPNPARATAMIEQMSALATASVAAIAGAGAALANPGAFIPLALKNISETDPSAAGYVVDWVFFALVSLLPLALALPSLLVGRDWAVPPLAAGPGPPARGRRRVAPAPCPNGLSRAPGPARHVAASEWNRRPHGLSRGRVSPAEWGSAGGRPSAGRACSGGSRTRSGWSSCWWWRPTSSARWSRTGVGEASCSWP